MVLGPVMLDVEGVALSDEDRELLRHPSVGGLILFARNFESVEQVAELCAQVHALREPPLLIAVDQEGGRVQRFREGFTRLPPPAVLRRIWQGSETEAREAAQALGQLMASELRACGVDLSFAPVLDVDHGRSEIIGDRSFHTMPEVAAALAGAYIAGMKQAGMAATGKHFPGHGAVTADSHIELPVDDRSKVDLERDLEPYRVLATRLAGVMTAHVVYPALDAEPASFSRAWIGGVLRDRIGFQGAVFSDDLSMQGAVGMGRPLERARRALQAGCDMVLVCNDRPAATAVIEGLGNIDAPLRQARLIRMHGRKAPDWRRLVRDAGWRRCRDLAASLVVEPELDLG